ncbi:MAG: hypothetical protein D6812_12980 [Deltaproteobacteria bacterium]|nr:MAG: hypothetical protein D6812_12980 [Deltaproteobacteria bacterium]
MKAPIVIEGRNRADTKKRALAFWFKNRAQVDQDLKGFLAHCRINPAGTRIVYLPDSSSS